MNATQRKELDTTHSELQDIKSRLETIQNAMQDSYDGKSEKWQEGEKGEAFKEKLDKLEETVGGFDDIIANVEELKSE